jgi:hypothetical protein
MWLWTCFWKSCRSILAIFAYSWIAGFCAAFLLIQLVKSWKVMQGYNYLRPQARGSQVEGHSAEAASGTSAESSSFLKNGEKSIESLQLFLEKTKYPNIRNEFMRLSETERRSMMKLMLEQLDGDSTALNVLKLLVDFYPLGKKESFFKELRAKWYALRPGQFVQALLFTPELNISELEILLPNALAARELLENDRALKLPHSLLEHAAYFYASKSIQSPANSERFITLFKDHPSVINSFLEGLVLSDPSQFLFIAETIPGQKAIASDSECWLSLSGNMKVADNAVRVIGIEHLLKQPFLGVPLLFKAGLHNEIIQVLPTISDEKNRLAVWKAVFEMESSISNNSNSLSAIQLLSSERLIMEASLFAVQKIAKYAPGEALAWLEAVPVEMRETDDFQKTIKEIASDVSDFELKNKYLHKIRLK